MRFLPLLVLAGAAATAQSPLTTTFANNNNGAAGGAIYFDLAVPTPVGIDITVLNLDINTTAAIGALGTLDIYLAPGTSVGNELTAPGVGSPWGATPITSGSLTSAGPGQPTAVALNTPFTLLGGSTYGCALVAQGFAHTYTNGGVIPMVYTTGGLTLTAGTATNVPFTGVLFTPRVPNLNIHFAAPVTFASNTTLGQGCLPALPLTLTGITRPLIGANWNLQVGNIPATGVFGVNFWGVADPGVLSLVSLGLPGCQLRATPDVLQGPWAVAGATFGYSGAIPADPSLANFELFAQAAVWQVPALNPFGAVTSNGIKGTLGNL